MVESPRAEDLEVGERLQISGLYALSVLATIMFSSRDDAEIVRLCATAVPSLGDLRTEVAYLVRGDQHALLPLAAELPRHLGEQILHIGARGGPVTVSGRPWARSLPLAGLSGWRGGLVVSAPQQPPESETFLLG